jgi:Ala-tRNA(Pro) deacylase
MATAIGDPKVYEWLDKLCIGYDYYEHPPLTTAEEAFRYMLERWESRGVGTTFCKNLFMRNHKGDRHFLIILPAQSMFGIHDLEKKLKQGKISFSSPHRLEKYLGVTPGSVSLFGLINDHQKHVHVFIDNQLLEAQKLSFHPNDNRASLVISRENMFKFLDHTGNRYEMI